MTEAERETINALRQRGFAVVIFSPEEVGDENPGSLEDHMVIHGNDYLDITRRMCK